MATKLKKSWPLVLGAVAISVSVMVFEHEMMLDAEQPRSKLATIYSEDDAYSSDLNEVAEQAGADRELDFLTRALSDNSLTNKLGDHKSEISKLFQQAVALARKGKVDQAIIQYQEIVALKPNHQMAAINLAILQQRIGEWQNSLTTLDKVLDVAGGSRKGKIYALIGRAYENQGKLIEATRYYRKSIDYRPAHVSTWRRLAKASADAQISSEFANAKGFHEVNDLFTKVIALDAQNATAFIDKAGYQFTRLDFDGVMETLDKSKHALFSDAQGQLRDQLLLMAYLERGQNAKIKKLLALRSKTKSAVDKDLLKVFAKISDKQHKKALSVWSKALKSNTRRSLSTLGNTLDQLLMADLYLENGKQVQAYKVLDGLSNQAESKSISTYVAAEHHRDLGQIESLKQAMILFESLLSSYNYQADVARRLSKVAMKLDDGQKSLSYAIVALRQGGEKRRFEFQRVQAERLFGLLPKALEMAEQLAQKYPKSRSALRLWADSLIDAGQTQLAIEKYRLLTKNNERRSDLHTLAKLLNEHQDLEASAEVLESLLAKYSDDVEARFLLAENMCRSQQLSECETQANRVLRLDDQHSGAKALIAQLSSTKNHG